MILLPVPCSPAAAAKLNSDRALAATNEALDCEGNRKSSLRKQTSLLSSSSPSSLPGGGSLSSRKSSKRDSRTVIIVEPDVIVSCDEYFAALHEVQKRRMLELQRRYESIGPLLIKLESLVLGTATGESFKMRLYYRHWEAATFSGLVRLVRNNLNAFHAALDDEEPLFQVDAQLMLPEIILRPSPNEIYEIIFQSVKDFLQRITALRRWLPGSCIAYDDTLKAAIPKTKARTSKKKLDEEEEEADCRDPPNFIDDILGDETVAQLLLKIQGKVQSLVQESKKYLIR